MPSKVTLVEEVKAALNEKFEEEFDPMKEKLDENSAKLEENTKKIDKLAEKDFNVEELVKDWKDAFGAKLKELAAGKIGNKDVSGWTGIEISSKALETTASFSGLIPEQWLRQVFQIPYDHGAFLASGPRFVPMSEVTNYALIGNRPAFTWKSQGAGEGLEAGGTHLDTTKSSTAREGAIATVILSNESLRMTNISLTDFFTEEIRRAWAKESDIQSLTANAVPFTGLKNLVGINQVQFEAGQTEFKHISRDYLLGCPQALKSSVIGSAGFFMSNNMKYYIHRKLVDENKRPLLDLTSNTLLGFPVWMSDELPAESDSAADTDLLYFGSTKIGALYSVEGVRIAMSEHAAFAEDNVVLRATVDCVLKHILPTAFVKMTTHA